MDSSQTNPSSTANDALWQFVTSVKAVQKRNGHQEPFNTDKLERSLAKAFAAAGNKDEFGMRSAAEKVLEVLYERFDGLATPTTQHVREIIVEVLSAQDLAEVASVFTAHPPKSAPGAFTPSSAPKTASTHPVSNAPSLSSISGVTTPVPKITPTAPTFPSSMPSLPPMPPTDGRPFTPTPAPAVTMGETHVPRRRRLSEERKAITHKFTVGTHEGYLTVGVYDDGQPGEIFLKMSKEGSVMSGLMDAFATAISIGLQYGVPLKVLVTKFAHMRFEPSGATQNPNIPSARSIIDYIFRWLALKFLTPEERQSLGIFGGGTDTGSSPSLIIDGARQPSLLDATATCEVCGAVKSLDASGACTHCGHR